MNPASLRTDFPILARKIDGHRLVYLDNAATSQKPACVIETLRNYYANSNANIHRGIHTLAEEATELYENARRRASEFVRAPGPEAVVFTRNATEAINLVRYSWARAELKPGDEILITLMEHHSNMVPWIEACRESGATLKHVRLLPDGTLDMKHFLESLGPRTRLVAATHVSNVLGTINPVAEMAHYARKAGALMLVDGAQSVPHMPVDFNALECDFLAFSSHKMLGPTGVGVLAARPELLERMPPFNTGGSMIGEVGLDRATWAALPRKFEAGTPNIAGVAAFSAAVDYLEKLGMEQVRRHEIDLAHYAMHRLADLKGLTLYGPGDPEKRGAVISFNDPAIHPHDLATVLDRHGIAIRAGHHCAQPLMRVLDAPATARASFYIYNDRDDVDALAEGIAAARRYFGPRNA